jgi:FkbM family methyltransferase
MNTLIEKLRRSTRYYYYRRKNQWIFPSNISHLAGGKMAHGSYEPRVSKILAENLKPGDTFVDVGANVGFFSRLASEIVGQEGAVYAFEADIANYDALFRNTNQYSNINPLHFAISDDNSFDNMNHSTHAACHSLVDTDNNLDGTQFFVPTMTLDHFWKHFLDKKMINVLKVDVEGAEIMVLKGMKNLVAENSIETLIIEFFPMIMKNAGFDESKFYRAIAANFSIHIIDPKYRYLVKDGTIDSISKLNNISNKLLEEDAVNINLLCQS